MPTVTKTFADVSLKSNYTAYTDYGGSTSVSTPTTVESARVSFTRASMGIPDGADIISAVITFGKNNPIHGTSIRRLTFNGTNYNSVLSPRSVVLKSSNTISWTFKSGTTNTSYPSAPTSNPSAVNTLQNSGQLDLTDIVLTVNYELPYTACKAPTSASVSPSVSEGDATLTFSGAAGGTGNAITGYEIQVSGSSDGVTWGDWFAAKVEAMTGGSGAISVAPSTTRGRYFKYQMRTRGAAGADYYSPWKAVSGTVRRNSIPSAPIVRAPATGKTIYSSYPRALVTVGDDADNQAQTIAAPGFSASSAGNLAIGKKIVLRRTNNLTDGASSIAVSATDSLGVSSAYVTRAFTYVRGVFDGSEVLTAGATTIKAEHMNELRTAVNNVRAYYGLAAYAWAEAITAGSTGLAGWKDHVLELRSAIDEVISLVNGWDTASSTHNIPDISWISIPTNSPSKAVMDQLRAVIPTL